MKCKRENIMLKSITTEIKLKLMKVLKGDFQIMVESQNIHRRNWE